MFWEIFEQLCAERKTTPNTVAKSLGLSGATCTHWKQRGNTPKGATLEKIANYFNVSVDYLMGKEKKLPISGELSEELSRFIQLLSKMNSEQKKFLLHLMQTMAQENQE